MQLPLFEPASSWRAPDMATLPDWSGASRVCIDVETRDDSIGAGMGIGVRRGGFICGYGIAIEDGPRFYLPTRHDGGDNVDAAQAHAYVKEQAKRFGKIVVGANLSYDLDYLAEEGIEFAQGVQFRDVQIAEPLLDELAFSYSLERLCHKYGFEGKDESELRAAAAAYGFKGKQVKGNLWRLPGRYAGTYAEGDVDRPLKILRRQELEIEKQELWGVFNLESKVLPILLKFRRRGVRIDFDKLAHIVALTKTKEAEALDRIFRETGYRLELNEILNPNKVAAALKAAGVQLPKTPKGKDKTDKDTLKALENNALAEPILTARKWNKIRTTFAQSIYDYQTNGRIHPTFNQLRKDSDDGKEGDTEGAAYGRLSCVDPNLQQQPARDPEIGPLWRSIYLPEDGKIWGCIDLSQQEPKFLIHWACITGTPHISKRAHAAALEARDRYRSNKNEDAYDAFASFCGLKRKDTKEVYLGRVYGMGGAKMAGKLNLPTAWVERQDKTRYLGAGPEAEAIIKRFDGGIPYAIEMAKLCEKMAKLRGYIRTFSGRKCRFPEMEGGGYDWTYKALNRLIQGSSADQTKQALVALDDAGFYIQLQVHDEVDGSFNTYEEARAAADIMENAVPLELPSKCDVEIGPNWGEIKDPSK